MMGFALALAGPRLAGAEVSEVRIVAQNGSNYLPLFVMQGQKLVEKQLAAKGLASTVVWSKLAGLPPSSIHSWPVSFTFPGRACVDGIDLGSHAKRHRHKAVWPWWPRTSG
jgi:hypothetical protein